MAPLHQIDFLVVGQGLAGSCLALQLLERGKKIVVIDEPGQNRATAIAAGLFNPVTGKYMTRTWRSDDLFPRLFSFYQKAQQQLGIRFFYPFPLYRPFLSVEEQNEWMGKSAEGNMMPYVDRVFSEPAFGDQVHDPVGGLLLKECGYLDTNGFMNAVRGYLRASGAFIDAHFDESQLQISNETVQYLDIEASKVIFCQGMSARRTRHFGVVPVRPLKGETLSIRTNQPLACIYNRGVYLAPSGEQTYKVGATYNTKDQAPGTTAEGKTELLGKLNALLKTPYQIVGHDWGIRPTTPDHKPILGPHPYHPALVIFNGLGTKGVSLAPYFSAQLADWLTGKGQIESSVHVGRFY